MKVVDTYLSDFKWPLLLLFILLVRCTPSQEVEASFSKVLPVEKPAFAPDFETYNDYLSSKDYEKLAVLSNFYGDYQSAVEYATKRKKASDAQDDRFFTSNGDKEAMQSGLQQALSQTTDPAERKLLEKAMELALRPNKPDSLFAGYQMEEAIPFIVDKADGYHFLLINEAHYNAQNRAFTSQLLEPLWEKGYRYLALEALGYQDSLLMGRGYPSVRSGYYFKDPVFGNMLREALDIGYQLIAYEIDNSKLEYTNYSNTFRDSMQAVNIYRQTLAKDQKGKVIVHAGYGHILELGDEQYRPMGSQLKALSGQDLLTVDQEFMCELSELEEAHPYYQHAIENYALEKPVVFVENEGEKALVDPVSAMGIDIQVYHPVTKYQHGRPTWRLSADKHYYSVELPAEWHGYEGHLFRFMKKGEQESAVPIDQFIYQMGDAAILPKGNYVLQIIDREGMLKAEVQVDVTE